MHVVFYKTNDVFIAEEKLKELDFNVRIVPTPVQDKAYCGVCVKVEVDNLDKINSSLSGMQYKVI